MQGFLNAGVKYMISMSRKEICCKYFEEPIKRDIIATLFEEEPLTTTAVAKRAGLCWRTAKKRLLELVDENKVVLRKVEGIRLFFLSPELKKEDAK